MNPVEQRALIPHVIRSGPGPQWTFYRLGRGFGQTHPLGRLR